MMSRFIKDAEHIYVAPGFTDFRKQSTSLAALVSMKFQLEPFDGSSVFVFCNKKKDAIKVLRYDRNGFVLAHKKLLEGMKFQWPMKADEVRLITPQQMEWLLEGLSIEQKKAHHEVKRSLKNSCY